MRRAIILKDNDTLSIVVDLGNTPTVQNSMGERTGMTNSFRVVASSAGPIFELLPYYKAPSFLTEQEMERIKKQCGPDNLPSAFYEEKSTEKFL